MNALSRWDPFKELEESRNRIAQLFGFASPKAEKGAQESMTVPQWAPSVDIVEDDKEWLVKADLPEVRREDVKVRVDDGVLAITGERRLEKEEKDKKYHRIERAYGHFYRSFTLPDGADATKVSAEFKDGLLKVHLPKGPKPAAKAVDIPVG